ncbi:unnamed protein product [Amoebophrya sp. A120]|nr:unnamed protein product [Amoebophrya sp. A120]|eukprot:GSA120T00018508001.1
MSATAASSSTTATTSGVRKDNAKLKNASKQESSKLETGLVFEDVDMGASLVTEEVEMDGEVDNENGDAKQKFAPLSAEQALSSKKTQQTNLLKQIRRIIVPQHRFSPLRNHWEDILKPLVEHMKLQVRMNTKKRAVEIRMSKATSDIGALQKATDFVKAFMMGFDVQDAIALLRLDDLFISSFEVKDVKRLQGDHLSRCIGRIAGKNGQTKYAIENATRTRVVVADSHIHILGSFSNIKFARDAICSLILGQAPSKVYQHLRTVTKRVQERL